MGFKASHETQDAAQSEAFHLSPPPDPFLRSMRVAYYLRSVVQIQERPVHVRSSH